MTGNNILNLRNREQYLFSDEEMNPRQNADREEVLGVFTPLATDIVMKILEAGDCYLGIADNHPVARQEHTFPSSVLHGLIIEYLSQINGVSRYPFCSRNSILEIGAYKVWVKKLDGRGMPWVNETKSSVKRVNQKAEGEDDMPVLILGYQLNQLEHISQIQLIYIEGDQHIWAPIDLGDIAATNQINMTPTPAPEEPKVTIKPRKQGEEDKTAL